MGKIVPRGKLAFLLFALVFVDNLSLIMVRIGFDQAFVNDILKPLTAKLEAASKKCEDKVNRTKADLIERDMLIDALRPEIQRAIELVRNLPHATIQDQKDLGIYIEPHTSAVKPPPKKSPLLDLVQTADGTATVRALNRETKKQGKPEGARGWVMKYAFGPEPPKTKAGYTHQMFISGGNCEIVVPDEYIGQPVHMRAYWVNTVGKPSQWSPVLTVIIA